MIRVWYVDAEGNWLCYDDSSPAFEISGSILPTLSVTTPDSAGPFAQAEAVPVNWTASNISDGYFHIYAYDGDYHYLASTVATGAASYIYDWTVLGAHRQRICHPHLVCGHQRQLDLLQRLVPGF